MSSLSFCTELHSVLSGFYLGESSRCGIWSHRGDQLETLHQLSIALEVGRVLFEYNQNNLAMKIYFESLLSLLFFLCCVDSEWILYFCWSLGLFRGYIFKIVGFETVEREIMTNMIMEKQGKLLLTFALIFQTSIFIIALYYAIFNNALVYYMSNMPHCFAF